MLSVRAQNFSVARLLELKDGEQDANPGGQCEQGPADKTGASPNDSLCVRRVLTSPHRYVVSSLAGCKHGFADDNGRTDSRVFGGSEQTSTCTDFWQDRGNGSDAPWKKRKVTAVHTKEGVDQSKKSTAVSPVSVPRFHGDEPCVSLLARKYSCSGQWNSSHSNGGVPLFPHPFVVTSAGSAHGVQAELCQAELCQAELWEAFHVLGTEMIVTRAGRRMFPPIRLRFGGLEPNAHYMLWLEFAQCGANKYRYVYHSSKWAVAGKAEADNSEPRVYTHPDSPFTGRTLLSHGVSFERVKLTNNVHPSLGQVSLTSMQKFQPRIHVEKMHKSPSNEATPVHFTFTFPQTSFIAVTAYQNQQITQLKIARNPFAKGFRESGKSRHGVMAVLSSAFQERRTQQFNAAAEVQIVGPNAVSGRCLQVPCPLWKRPRYDATAENSAYAENVTHLLRISDVMHTPQNPFVFYPDIWSIASQVYSKDSDRDVITSHWFPPLALRRTCVHEEQLDAMLQEKKEAPVLNTINESSWA